MKLPAIPGMDEFEGTAFHTARWDYEYTGGGPGEPLTKLADKVVGVIGTGASGIQARAAARPNRPSTSTCSSARRRRSVCAATARPTRASPSSWSRGGRRHGWTTSSAVMIGRPVERDLVDDGWTRHYAAVQHPPRSQGHDDRGVHARRPRRSTSGSWRSTGAASRSWSPTRVAAESLKPYYRYLCKRPCFHDEYFDAFNRPNVTLVDCPAGIERDHRARGRSSTARSTRSTASSTPPASRRRSRRFSGGPATTIIGRGGITLAEKWADGAVSLFGMMTRGFPNMFVMPAPGQQSVVTVNYTQLAVVGAEFVAGDGRRCSRSRASQVFDVERRGRGRLDQTDRRAPSSTPARSCPRARRRASTTKATPAASTRATPTTGGGFGDFFGYQDLLDEWLASGDFDGLDARDRRSRRDASSSSPGVAVGIGAAIAEELGAQGVFVVTVDPRCPVDGSPSSCGPRPPRQSGSSPPGARRGRRASRSPTRTRCAGCSPSWSKSSAALDAVVNVAGISRPTGFAHGAEDDWRAVLSVHVDGYLNVLARRVAAHDRGRTRSDPRGHVGLGMARRRRRRVQLREARGVRARRGASGRRRRRVSGERAVAHRRDPHGARRARRAGAHPQVTPRPVGCRSGSPRSHRPSTSVPSARTWRGRRSASWSRGQIMFSNGAELAWVVPPRLLEVACTSDVGSLLAVLESFGADVLSAAEATQASNGGGNPRLEPRSPTAPPTAVRRRRSAR